MFHLKPFLPRIGAALLAVGAAMAAAQPAPHSTVQSASQPASGTQPASAAWQRAQCVAALETQADALAARIQAGQADLEPLLRARLRAGAAFVGQAWLAGERDEAAAKALLEQARQAQGTLPADALASRQESCAADGEKLLAASNAFSRAVVSRVAERRLKKLLGR